jgi:hypothetical protein
VTLADSGDRLALFWRQDIVCRLFGGHYINWSKYFDIPSKVPQDYPQLYDRALANHGGKGIYIACVNNGVFWDRGATWLRNFAASHPQYEIPIPK